MEARTYVIPYLPVLDALELSSQEMVMESKALRLPIMENNWRNIYPYSPITVADLAYSAKGVYCRFWSKGIGLKAGFAEDGEKVHEDTCVGLFMQLPGADEYFRFAFNCIGTCCASKCAGNVTTTPLPPEDMPRILRASSERRGMIFDRPQGVYSFWVSVFIPFSVLGVDLEADGAPSYLRMNLFKCGDTTTMPHALSWQPISSEVPNFYQTKDFVPIYFGKR